jgi:hypothetical protein
VRARLPAAAALALALSAAGGPAPAATLDAASLSYLPLHYYAGDEVLIVARVLPEKGERLAELDLRPGEGLPSRSGEADPEIRALKLSKSSGSWTIEARFVPWSPGPGSLAESKIGGIRIPALPYAALSLLGPEDRDPTPPRPQRQLPGAALFLYGSAGAIAILALLAAAFFLYLLPAARSLLARRREERIFKRLDKSLDYLAREAGAAEDAAFFAALVRALRLYLAARFLPAAPALTASELEALPDEAFPAPATRRRTAALVALADRRRFGGEAAAPAEAAGADASAPASAAGRGATLAAAVEEARAIAAANEEALRARV